MTNFFSLPFEVRQQIYALMLANTSSKIEASARPVMQLLPRDINQKNILSRLPAALSSEPLKVCHQFHDELMDMLWEQYVGKVPFSIAEKGGWRMSFHEPDELKAKPGVFLTPLGVKFLEVKCSKDIIVCSTPQPVLLEIAENLTLLQEIWVDITFDGRSIEPWIEEKKKILYWHKKNLKVLSDMFMPLAKIGKVNLKLIHGFKDKEPHLEVLFAALQESLSEWAWIFNFSEYCYVPPKSLRSNQRLEGLLGDNLVMEGYFWA